MAEFKGYLLAFNGVIFPNKYIAIESFKSSPNQRLEIEAYRDANSYLNRVTSKQYKSKVEFNTLANLTLKDKIDMFNVMKNGRVNEVQQSYNLTYWNDSTSDYRTGLFYMPNIEITIKTINENNVFYNPIRIAFIEY